jgi:MOSC domain-containing protein YiiM
VRSVNLAGPTGGDEGRRETTGIRKRSVARIDIRTPSGGTGTGSGVLGDLVANRRHHGGVDKAVYAFSREELDWWERQLGRDLPDGVFGENLTTRDIDLESLLVGQRVDVGSDLSLEVSLPRQPCATFARHMGEKRWVPRFTARGRCGVYLRVLVPGPARPGDLITVGPAPSHGVDIRVAFAAAMGDDQAALRVVAARCLPPQHHDRMARRVSRR